jgi:hypothetical protein
MKNYFLIIALLLFLAGCAEPIPNERMMYVGDWQSPQMRLTIFADGRVAYLRSEGNRSTSVEGPLKEFKGDSFEVGVWFLTTTFDVSEPPHQEDGVWKMTVDGVELIKNDD